MIDGTPVTFECEDHGWVPLDGLRDCYLTTMIGEGLFIRSEFRPLGNATNRFEFDRATLERHGIDTSTVERWESWGRGEGVWESMFEPRYRTSDSAGGTISYAFNHDETGQAMTDRKQLEEAVVWFRDELRAGARWRPDFTKAGEAILAAAEAHLASLPGLWKAHAWYSGTACDQETVLFYGSEGEARASAAKAIAGGARKAEVTGP